MIKPLNKNILLQTLDNVNLLKQLIVPSTLITSPAGIGDVNKDVINSKVIQGQGVKVKGVTNISKLLEKVNNLQNLDYNKEIINETNKLETNLIPDLAPLNQASLDDGSMLTFKNKEEDGNTNTAVGVGEERLKIINLYTYLNYLSKFNNKIAKAQYNIYCFNKENNNLLLFNKAIKIITLTFLSMGCLISKPHFTFVSSLNKNNLGQVLLSETGKSTKKIRIQLFYFVRYSKNLNNLRKDNLFYSSANHDTVMNGRLRTQTLNRKYNAQPVSAILNKNLYQRYQDKFDLLSAYLTTLFRCDIELDLIRLNKPYYNSNILVQYLALQSYKNRFVRLVSRLFRKMNIYYNKKQNLNNLTQPTDLKNRDLNSLNFLNNKISNLESFPSFVSGLHIRMAGRTFKQKIIPRMTVKQTQKGVLSSEKVRLIEKSRFTGKTKRGSYSFTVTLGHIL